MKGLLIKDFRLMKNQRTFLILVLIMTMFLIVSNGGKDNSGSFVLVYIGFVSAYFAVGTINYDEFNNGYSFLFTLPFDRKSYTLEKYLFGILSGAAGIVIALLLLLLYTLLCNPGGDVKLILFTAGITVGLLLLFLAVMLPIQLKFGAEKGRIALIVVFLGIFAVSYGAARLLPSTGIFDFIKIKGLLEEISIWEMLVAVFAVSIISILVSAAVSMRILEKKEF